MIKRKLIKISSNCHRQINIAGYNSFCVLLLLLGFIPFLFAQDTLPENKYIHFEGSMGQKKYMILDLHKFSDSIFGTYYNQIEGQLHYFSGKTQPQSRFFTTEPNGDSLNGEFVNLHNITGYVYDRESKSKSNFSFTETDYFGSMLFKADRNIRTYGFSDKPLYPTFKVDLMLLFPEGNVNKLVEDSVQDYIIGYYFGQNIVFNSNDNMLKFLSNNYYLNYAAHYKTNAFDYRSSLLKWSALQDVQILFNENFVLTFCLKQNTSNWLPETIWDKIYFVINLKTCNKITPDEIFVTGYKEKLRNLITARLKQQFNITTSLQTEGFYKQAVNKFDNLFVSREGVGFHYNPGDLAPDIFGEIDVFLSFDELKDILLPKGIIYTLVQ
jgi:hypothetical protein